MIKFQQSQALTSHFESFWSIMASKTLQDPPGHSWTSLYWKIQREKANLIQCTQLYQSLFEFFSPSLASSSQHWMHFSSLHICCVVLLIYAVAALWKFKIKRKFQKFPLSKSRISYNKTLACDNYFAKLVST